VLFESSLSFSSRFSIEDAFMSVPFRFRVVYFLLFVLLAVAVDRAAAVNVRIDFSTDRSDFFDPSTDNGAAARAAILAAAQFYSDSLEDTFSPIATQKFYSAQGGETSFFWKRRFIDPATGLNNAAVNQQFDENEYVVYVGARDLPGVGQLGAGGPGGFDNIFSRSIGQFTDAEKTQAEDLLDDLSDAIGMRGQTSGFARWGGSIAFDSPTPWHFNHTTSPTAGTQDFYSVALHELAHAIGFGGSDAWEDLVDGTGFTGANALVSHAPAGNVPLASADDTAHWVAGIAASPVYEGAGNQTPLMVANISTGLRRALTNLDAAALADIGWQIDLPGGSASALTLVTSGNSESTSAAMFALTGFAVPEPASAALLSFAGLSLLFVHRRRR
jgi:hypothetical protein